MSLARFGVRNPVPVNLLMIALLIAGVYAAATTTREFFPDTTPESCVVSFIYPGATPEEIEENLVRKIEDAVFDLDEVESIVVRRVVAAVALPSVAVVPHDQHLPVGRVG